jgi:hypothetical protein
MRAAPGIATAVALALVGLAGAPAARGAEPADDQLGGAVPVKAPGLGTIDHPGDVDWYTLDVALNVDPDVTSFVGVRIVNGNCAPGAVHLTVLNPEGKPYAWAKVATGDEPTSLPLHTRTPGRYYVVVDASGDPTCSGVTYRVVLAAVAPVTADVHAAECRAARAALRTDQVLAARYRKAAGQMKGSQRRRYIGYVKLYKARLPQDRATVRRQCHR